MATVNNWDKEVDVVVVGSGAAALTAAVLASDGGADTLLMESAKLVGGTTALSGGGIWIGVNHHMEDLGIKGTREEALTYAKRISFGRASDELVETFIDTGAEMVRYMEQQTRVKFIGTHMPDYHAEEPGGKAGGRTLEPELFPTPELGEWESKLRRSASIPVPLGFEESVGKYRLMAQPQNFPMELVGARMDKGLVGTGTALVGMLLKSCLDRKIPILLETRGVELIAEEGRVIGIRAQQGGKDLLIRARGAVILGCGGYEWNADFRNKFLPGPVAHHCSPDTNVGDGLMMCMELGADLANMNEAWLYPGAVIPGIEYEGHPLSHWIISERSLPHSVLVNRYGERFVEETANYNDLSKALLAFDPTAYDYRNLPAWLIIDSQYRSKYPFLGVMAGDPDPEWLVKDDTLAGLARKVGIDPKGLEETVERFNGFVRRGKDEDFHRGEGVYGQWMGGDLEAPHPNLGTIERPPFYTHMVQIHSCGTKGGPRTNTKAQVMHVRGHVIPGLYAAGNTMAGVAGPGYFGGGATIGPAMVFGYIAGINAAKDAKAVK